MRMKRRFSEIGSTEKVDFFFLKFEILELKHA